MVGLPAVWFFQLSLPVRGLSSPTRARFCVFPPPQQPSQSCSQVWQGPSFFLLQGWQVYTALVASLRAAGSGLSSEVVHSCRADFLGMLSLSYGEVALRLGRHLALTVIEKNWRSEYMNMLSCLFWDSESSPNIGEPGRIRSQWKEEN